MLGKANSVKSVTWPFYLGFVVAVVGLGTVIGSTTLPGEWYRALNKPAFNPPNWVFGPAWTFLYICIGVAGARLWTRARKSTAMNLWFAQMVANFIWSPVFFGVENITAALVIILSLLAIIIAFIAKAWNVDRVAAYLFVPYLAWVAFASTLNGSIWWLN